MANPYQHGELKHAAFEALRGASAGLTLEEIAARINEMHENDSEVFQLRRRGRNPLQALAVLLPKTVKPKDPTFERVEDVSNDPSTNWATVRYRLADPTAREDTDEDDDNDAHKHSKKRSRSISNSGTLGFGKRMKQGESDDIDTAVAALLTAANQVNRTAEAEETARAKADLAKATAVVPAPAPAPPPPPPPAPGPPPAPSTFTQPPASDAGALLGGLSQEQVKQLLASINLAKQGSQTMQGSQAMGAQTQEQRISGLLQQRISTLSSAVQNAGVGATNNGLNPLLAALSNLQQNKANAAAMAAGMPVSLPMNLPPPPPPQPVLRQVPLNATGKFPTRTDLINLLQAANEQQQQQQQQHTGLGGLASLPPQGLSNPALAAGLALAQKLAAVKNAQQMAQPQNGISNLSPLMASIAAAPQIGGTVPNAMPNVSAALSNITSLLPASHAPDMAPSIQDTVRGLIKSTISNLGNGERPRPQAPAPEPPKLSGATRGRRDPEVRRMQNREAAQRHRAKHMRERKEKDAECQRLRNEMLDMKECIQKLTGTLKNLIENTEAPTVDVRDAVNLLIQVSEKKLDVLLVGDTAFAGPAATSLMETSPMPANVPPQVVPSVPGVSADPTEHWRPGVGVVEFTAAAVERGLVPRGISVTVNGGSAYMNRDPKHLAAPGTGASGGDDDTADDGDADGVSAATIDEEELDGDAVVDDATNFVVAGAP